MTDKPGLIPIGIFVGVVIVLLIAMNIPMLIEEWQRWRVIRQIRRRWAKEQKDKDL